jgi:hypothetical protein
MIISPERLDPFADGNFHHLSFPHHILPFPPLVHGVSLFL